MERKYKSICESLDLGDNKKALQECDKLLRKFETKKHDKLDVKFIRALKCLGLCRIGKRTEAVEILTTLLAEKPSDVDVLQVLQTVCKELRLYETLATMFENAAKVNSTEEVLSNLFMACVINSDYKRQQQVALKLHQTCPDKNHYYFWSVTSIVMQAISEPKLARSIYLPLAEKLCYKFIQDNRINADTEILVYLDILKRQEHCDQAIKFLQESSLVKGMEEMDYRQTRLAEFQYMKKDWRDAFDSYKQLLANHPNQWLFWERLVDCVLQLVATGDGSKIGDLLQTINDAQAKSSVDCNRAAILAPLHLLKVSKDRNVSHEQLAKLSAIGLFKTYLKHFASKPCAVDDLKTYLSLLSSSEIKEVCLEISHSHVFFKNGTVNGKSSSDSDGNEEKSVESKKGSRLIEEIEQIITREALLFYKDSASDKVGIEVMRDRVNRLKSIRAHYDSQNGGSVVNEGDFRPGDRIVVLIARSLFEIFHRTSDTTALYEAGELLMAMPHNNYFKQLLLLLSYNFLGAGLHAFYVFMKLDIKHIQFETLGYLALTTLSQSGSFQHYSIVLDSCLRQTAMSGVEFSHTIPLAYHYGTFTKIPEMVELQQRLRSSIEYFQYTLEKMIFDLTMSPTENLPSVAAEIFENLCRDRIPWNDLVLTRDYNPLSTCFFDVPTKENQENFLDLQKVILRLSVAEAKLVSSCVSQPNMEEVTTIGSELINVAHDLKAEYDKLTAASNDIWPAVPFLHCWPMHSLDILPARCLLLTSVARLSARIVSAMANYENSEQDPLDDPMIAERDLIHDIESQIKELSAQVKLDEGSFENQSATLNKIYGITRTFCEVSVCLIVPVERMRFVRNHQAKLAKKRKDISMNANFYEIHNDLAKTFKEAVDCCNKVCGELREKFHPIALESAASFRGRVFESYCGQLQQLSERLGRLSNFNLNVKEGKSS